MTEQEKAVFQYDNYRHFLRDYYLKAKAKDKKFSYRFFARILGYTSPIFVKRVIDGSRNLTEDGIQRFIKALKFNKEEAEFFKHLVLLNQAKTEEEKRIYAQKLLRTRTFRRLLPLKEAQFNYYAHWYLVPVRELVGLPQFKEDPQWIAEALTPSITPVQAKRAMDELLRLGLIERDANGKLCQTTIDVTTPDEIVSTFKADWLVDIIRMGGESIKRIAREKRDISSVTIGVSVGALENIKELARNFRRDVMEAASREQDSSQNVYQLNIQLFPLTKLAGEKK
jgi:uncharacterized protein (TIGR02147 family)